MIAISEILFILSILFLIYSFVSLKNTSRQIRLWLSFAITAAILGTASHCFLLVTPNPLLANILYSVFFVSIDVICLSLFMYSRYFTNFKVKISILTYLFYFVYAVDIITLLLNIPFNHAFTLYQVPFGNQISLSEYSSFVFKINKLPYYNFHLALSYVSIILTFTVLIIKMIKVPKPYKFMYYSILSALLIAVIGDALYVFIPVPADFSILFISICAILICHFSCDYIPQKLISLQLKNVVACMNDAVKIFDYEGNEFYNNAAMVALTNKLKNIGYESEKLFEKMNPKFLAEESKYITNREFTQDIKTEKGTLNLLITICFPRDDEGKFLGTFIIIHDRTREVEIIGLERYKATHDQLTGIYNAETFYEKTHYTISSNMDEDYIIICSDIDNFKLINDLFGKDVADEFLCRIANSLKTYTKEGEIYARLDNDHFALLMKKSDYSEQKFISLPSQVAYISQNLGYPVKIHIGVYEIDDITVPVSVMCDRAFMAIKTIKGNFQKMIAYYNDDLRKTVLREQQLIGDFSGAIASNQFEMYLQPQISADGVLHGAEALVRWNHPKEGLISPAEFISLFERNGIISTLDKYIWEQAAQKLKEWQDKGIEDIYISINISPRDFIYLDVYDTITSIVEKYQIPPERLNLELTESGILLNFEKQLALIRKLQEYGFSIEMDDFGSGYSSLNLLKDIPFDILKIDMAFLQETENQERSVQILHSIVKLSKRLNMPVISEGVETQEQLDLLTEIGADLYQGFFFSRPIPVTEFEEKYLKHF